MVGVFKFKAHPETVAKCRRMPKQNLEQVKAGVHAAISSFSTQYFCLKLVIIFSSVIFNYGYISVQVIPNLYLHSTWDQNIFLGIECPYYSLGDLTLNFLRLQTRDFYSKLQYGNDKMSIYTHTLNVYLSLAIRLMVPWWNTTDLIQKSAGVQVCLWQSLTVGDGW